MIYFSKKEKLHKTLERNEPESLFDQTQMNKRELKEFEKATHVVLEIQSIDKNIVWTIGDIKHSKIVHISKNRNVTLAWIKKLFKPQLSKVLKSSWFVKKTVYEMELRELSTPFDCFQNSTVFVIARCSNPGIYAIYAGQRNDKFYYYSTKDAESTLYYKDRWVELNIENESTKHIGNTKQWSAWYDGRDSVYLIGGWDSSAYKSWFRFDFQTHQRIKMPSMNEARWGHSSYLFSKENSSTVHEIEVDSVEKDQSQGNYFKIISLPIIYFDWFELSIINFS